MFPGTVTTNKMADRVAVATDNSNGALSSSHRVLPNDIVVTDDFNLYAQLVSAANDVTSSCMKYSIS